ncbi:MAG: hypothetical protein JSV92_00370 [archaeon]|nr:MAG: hypothetical protein JSV92_00370 [archaeon]
MTNLATFRNENLRATVNLENGQLVSLVSNGTEFFHDGGKPSFKGLGWRHSEIIAFPIFGPPGKDFKVRVDDKEYYLEQHGLTRFTEGNPFKLTKLKDGEINLVQNYKGQDVVNPKYQPGTNHPKTLNWMPYRLEKKLKLSGKELIYEATIKNTSDADMPYMIGTHPAFKIFGKLEDSCFFDEKDRFFTTLSEVIKDSKDPSKNAFYADGVSEITYRDSKGGVGVKVSSNDFNKTMLWCPGYDEGMFCIEHLSKFPKLSEQDYFEHPEDFELLSPGKEKTYSISIQPIPI